MEYGDERLPQRFWDKVSPEPNTGCWLWTAYLCQYGYGHFSWEGGMRRPHHLTNGRPEKGMHTDHLCRVRSCVNPEHLEIVTPQENIRRGDAGKYNKDKTHCRNGHEFTEENIEHYKGERRCRICRRAAWSRWYVRKKARSVG